MKGALIMRNVTFIILAVGTGLLISGCSTPFYTRSVVKKYDASGKLQETTVTEIVTQQDPFSKPVMGVLQQQTYKP
jgi:hypothetical protein